MAGRYVSQFLDTNGDGTGTIEANGDYHRAEQSFFIQPPDGRIYSLFRAIIWIKYPGNFNADKYGDSVVLTNGIRFRVFNGQTNNLSDLLGGQTVKTNGNWANYSFDTQILVSEAPKYWFRKPGHSVFMVHWQFSAAGTPLFLTGRNGDRAEMILNDNFSGLSGHRFLVHFQDAKDLLA